jgi:hypothetical protein
VMRCYILPVFIALIICPLSWAGESDPEAYLVLPLDAKEGALLEVGQKQYRVQNVKLDDVVESWRILSQDNCNTRYWINMKPTPFPEKNFHGLIVKGKGFLIVSSGHGASGEMIDSISFYADSQIATKVAKAFKVPLEKRHHPGHKLRAQFVFDETNGRTVILTITNLGDNTVIFTDGGMNRGMRNNQFGFAGFRNSKPMLDRGSPVNFGGMSTYVTLKQGKTFEKSVDLTKWFDLSEKGYYDIIGTFYLEFHSSIEDHRILWTDYVGARFTFTRE